MPPPPKKYYNKAQTYTAQCGAGYTGSHTTTVPARFFYSYESVDEANKLAMNEAIRVANANLICMPVTVTTTTEAPPVTTTTTEAPAVKWYFWCYEGETVEVPPNTRVRYGQGAAWVEKIMSGTVTANNETFGDPIYGVAKQLEAVIEKPAPPVTTTTTEAPVTTQEPIPVERVNVFMSDYGITLSEADNSAANDPKIARLAADLSGPNKPKFRVHAPAGGGKLHWGEASLSWASRIVDLEFNGNGCQIQPHARYAWQGMAFTFNRFYSRGKEGYVYAPMFKTVRAGEYRIPLERASDASMFHVGQRILPMGRELQRYGYPPNLAYYEWPIVKSVGQGFIDIVDPLECGYNQKWQDTIDYEGPGSGLHVGKPRIWLLDVPSENYYWTRYIKFSNFSLLHNPQSAAEWGYDHSSVLFWEGEEVHFENIVLNQYAPLWPTQSKITGVKNCQIPYGIEVDKVCGTVLVEGGKSGGISGATGCKELIIKAHEHPFCNTSAIKEHWEGNKFNTDFYAALQPQPEGMHTREIVFKNNVLNVTGIQDGAVHRCYDHSLTIDGVEFTTDGSYIYVGETDKGKHANKGWIHDILFFNSDCSQVYKIVDVEWENNKYKLITTAPAGTFKIGQYWEWEGGVIVDSGNTIAQWGRPVLGPECMRWAGNTNPSISGIRDIIWTEDNFRWHPGGGFRYVLLKGTIYSIEVEVITPYTGGYCVLGLFKNDWGHQEENRLLNIDMKQAGVRILKPFGAVGLKSGDYFNAAKMNGFFRDVSYANHTDITEGQQRPRFRYKINWNPYYNLVTRRPHK